MRGNARRKEPSATQRGGGTSRTPRRRGGVHPPAAGARRRIRSVCVSLFILCVSASCEWFTDFKRQPSVWTWEPLKDSLTPSRGNPANSVPVTGMAVPGFSVSYAALPGTIDSMAGLANPTPVSEASLANGRKYYQINCAVCHGDAGAGDGTATKFGMPGISIVSDITRGRSDGYVFGMMRNGRGLMPSYNRIEETDRWDVVNYLRGLQGATGAPVPTGPLAAPGVTGDKLPGYSRLAPARPAPFLDPAGRVRGGIGRPNAAAAVAAPVTARDSIADPAAADTSNVGRRQ